MSAKKQFKIISVLSQKGGVSKSGLSASIATHLAKNRHVLLADMDSRQASTYEWGLFRQANKVKPEVDVAKFNSFQVVAKSINPSNVDFLIVDGAANSEKQSILIGVNSDLVVIPTCPSVVDLNPQIRFANMLEDAGLEKSKIVFVFTKVGSSKKEYEEAHKYLKSKVHFGIIGNYIPEKVAFRIGWRIGKSFGEVSFPSLREKANSVITEIVNKVK